MNSRRLLILLGILSMSPAMGAIAVSSPAFSTGETFAAARTGQSSSPGSPEIAKLRAEWVKDLHTKQLGQIASLYSGA